MTRPDPKVAFPKFAILDKIYFVNAQILLHILPDLRSRYGIVVDGEEIGQLETLSDATLVRDCLKERDFSVSKARVIFQEVRTRNHKAAVPPKSDLAADI